ncbi:MAG: RNA pyrophosphohydrolase, partial [Alphaproteobacteria bacterium]|nr:RNA pyrophosphohydrolase [Alphaproteobacteria bacterium]
AWQMPQGGIDAGENPKQAALRELKEETSITQIEMISESSKWLSYDFPDDVVKKFGGKIKGQQQKWFLMRFVGKDEDINLNTKYPEFSNWKWVEPSKVLEYITPFKRDVYKAVIEEFAGF